MPDTVPPGSHHLSHHPGRHVSRRGCIYRYRRRLPGEARGREVVVSLRTRRYREAEYRAALLDRAWDDALARARQAVRETGEGGIKADLNAIRHA